MTMKLIKPITAIVCDDDYDTTKIFSEFLVLEGINVIGQSYDGLDAVSQYEQLRPEITFLDVMMPNHDGIYALEKIKKINPDAIVIMVTADLKNKTYEKLEELHASAIIYKPYDVDSLMATVHRLRSISADKLIPPSVTQENSA